MGNILSSSFTPELRSMARGSEWPARAAYDMEINYVNGNLDLQYSQEMAEEIENLEYGDINSLPRSVIRPFIYSAQPKIEEAYEVHALDLLFMEGGVI